MTDKSTLYPAFGKQIANWFLFQNNKRIKPNILTFTVKITHIDKNVAATAFALLIKNHESLRTTFTITEEGVQQVIQPYNNNHHLLTYIACKSSEHFLKKRKILAAQIQNMCGDLEHGPLCKGVIFELANGDCYFQFFIHHIIADTWSLNLIQKQLFDAYTLIKDKHDEILPPPDIQLKEYSLRHKKRDIDNAAKEYWKARLLGMEQNVNLRSVYAVYNMNKNASIPRKSFAPNEALLKLDVNSVLNLGYGRTCSMLASDQTAKGVSALSSKYRTTSSVILLASFLILLRSLFRTNEILIISRLNGRFDPISHNIIGNFTSAVYLRFNISDTSHELSDIINLVREEFLNSLAFAVHNPLILKEIPITRKCHLCVNIVFDENADIIDDTHKPTTTPTHFILENSIVVSKKNIYFNWIFSTLLFRNNMIQFIADEHQRILEALISTITEDPLTSGS